MSIKKSLQFPTPLGVLTLVAHHTALLRADFDRPATENAPNHPILAKARQQLEEYFAKERTVFDIPLGLEDGTLFQRSVWQQLLPIPFGRTCSYGDIARAIDNPRAVRAVGGAVGKNPLSIIVPCHRVIGSDGSLTGFSGGMHRKIALLEWEGVL
ncbi:MAG: hypothetical protein RLZZ495_450 [Pseudomonadota bacterium]|jgi:methylated-DNA-[protein]-cysteine S-methyltransferase